MDRLKALERLILTQEKIIIRQREFIKVLKRQRNRSQRASQHQD
jgi:hypothetical protein